MELKHGTVYSTPDGRRFRARAEIRRSDPNPTWTLVPVTLDEAQDVTLRSILGYYLFLEKGRFVFFEFATDGPFVRETKWTVDDLVPT